MTGFLNTIGVRLSIFAFVVIAPLVFASHAFAAPLPAEELGPTILESAKAGAIKSGYRLAIATCLRDRLGPTNTTVSAGDVSGGNIIGSTILGSNQINVGSLIRPNSDDNTGRYMCGELNGTKLDEAKAAYGQGSGTRIEFFCGTKAIKRMDGSPCTTGTGDFGHDNSFDNAKANLNGGSGYTGPQLYLTAYYELLQSGCRMRDPILDANANLDVKNTKLSVSVVNSAGGINTVWYTVNLTKNLGIGTYFAYPYVQQEDGSNTNLNCTELIGEMNKHAGEYGMAITTAPTGDKKPNDSGNTPGSGASGGESTCNVEGVGWIVCPVTTFLAGINQNMFTFISGFLDIPPTLFSDTSVGGNAVSTKNAWNTFRSFANILFIVAFLIIVYSQITSVGITNYGVKKLLPKLIIAAILVNTSYYICMLAIDISNILGYGIQSLFTSIGGGIAGSSAGATPDADYSWGTIIVGALAASTAIVLAILAVSVPVLLAGLLALGMTALILVARQALVILLVVVSPVAFVLYLLPNTEKWFKKWWDLLFAMLILFPAVSLLFGAGSLASQILRNTAADDITSTGYWFPRIAALAASVLPLFALIPIVQNSLKGAGALGSKLAGWSQKANSRVGNKVKTDTKLGRGWSQAMANRAANRANRQNTAIAKKYRGLAGLAGGKGYKNTLLDRATEIEAKEHNEAVARTSARLQGMSEQQVLDIAENKDGKQTAAQRQAAAAHLIQTGSHDFKKKAVVAGSSITGGKDDADGKRARAAVANEYAKSDLSSLHGKAIANDIRDGKKIDMDQKLRENFGSVTPQTLASNEKYAEDVARVYGNASQDQKDQINESLDSVEATPQLIGSMSAKAKKAVRDKIRPGFGLGGGATGSGGSGTGGSGGGGSGGSGSGGGSGGGTGGGGSGSGGSGGPGTGGGSSGGSGGGSGTGGSSGGGSGSGSSSGSSGGSSGGSGGSSGGSGSGGSGSGGSSSSTSSSTSGPLPGGGTTNLFSSGVGALPHSSTLVPNGTPAPSAGSGPSFSGSSSTTTSSSTSNAASAPTLGGADLGGDVWIPEDDAPEMVITPATPSSASSSPTAFGSASSEVSSPASTPTASRPVASSSSTPIAPAATASSGSSTATAPTSAPATSSAPSNWGERVGNAATQTGTAVGGVLGGASQVVSGAEQLVGQVGNAAETVGKATVKGAVAYGKVQAAPTIAEATTALHTSTQATPSAVQASPAEQTPIAIVAPAPTATVVVETPPTILTPAAPQEASVASPVSHEANTSAPTKQPANARTASAYFSTIPQASPQMKLVREVAAKIAKERNLSTEKVMEQIQAGTNSSGDSMLALRYLQLAGAEPNSAVWSETPSQKSMVTKTAAQHRLAVEQVMRGMLPPDEPKI